LKQINQTESDIKLAKSNSKEKKSKKKEDEAIEKSKAGKPGI
jgi:hypothetical protein